MLVIVRIDTRKAKLAKGIKECTGLANKTRCVVCVCA